MLGVSRLLARTRYRSHQWSRPFVFQVLMVGNQLPSPRLVMVCLVPGSCSVLPVMALSWHTDGTARALVALVLVVFWYSRERALPGWGLILSPSATLRVAGQSPAGQGGAPDWTNDLGPRGFGLLGLSWLMASGWTSTTSTTLLPWSLLCPVHP